MILRKTHCFKLLRETVKILTTYNKILPKTLLKLRNNFTI